MPTQTIIMMMVMMTKVITMTKMTFLSAYFHLVCDFKFNHDDDDDDDDDISVILLVICST